MFGAFFFNLALLLAVSAARAEDYRPLKLEYDNGSVVAQAEILMYNYSASEIYDATLRWMEEEFSNPNRKGQALMQENKQIIFTGQSREVFYTELYTSKILYDFSYQIQLDFEDEKLIIQFTHMSMTGDDVYGAELELLYRTDGELNKIESYHRWSNEANEELNRLATSLFRTVKENKVDTESVRLSQNFNSNL